MCTFVRMSTAESVSASIPNPETVSRQEWIHTGAQATGEDKE